jgi:GNAT superfamily N-acetyltransferase
MTHDTAGDAVHIRRAMAGPLGRFNETQTGQLENYRPLAILVTHLETAEILGGLSGETMFSHLHVDLLFLRESLRRNGIGRRLMNDAEREAIRRGCRGAWLDTDSFQARELYERLGYTIFGTIDDYPPGHSRIFLKRTFLSHY